MKFFLFFISASSLWKEDLIIEPDYNGGSIFGHSIASCRTRTQLIVGAEWETVNQIEQLGTVYIYEISFNNVSKNSQSRLLHEIIPNPTYTYQEKTINISNFGSHVAFNDDCTRIIAGAPKSTVNGIKNAGAILIYDLKDNNWNMTSILTNSVPIEEGGFGRNLEISHNGKILASASFNSPSETAIDLVGSVSIYEENTNHEWINTGTFYPNNFYKSRFGSDLQFTDQSTLLIASNDQDENISIGTSIIKRTLDGWKFDSDVPIPSEAQDNLTQFGTYISMPLNAPTIIALTSKRDTEQRIYIMNKDNHRAWSQKPLEIIEIPKNTTLNNVQFCDSDLLASSGTFNTLSSKPGDGVVHLWRRGYTGHFELFQVLTPVSELPYLGFGSSIAFNRRCNMIYIGAHAKQSSTDPNPHYAYNYSRVYVFRDAEMERPFQNASHNEEAAIAIITVISFGVVLIVVITIFCLRKRTSTSQILKIGSITKVEDN